MVGVFTFRGERGKGRVGGGKRRKQDGREGEHPSEMECMERGQFSCKNKSVCRLSHLQSKQPSDMAASFYTSKPHSSFKLPN